MMDAEVSRLKIIKKPLLFCVGGACYVGMELLWRGWSHIAMFFAGGICFLLIGGLTRVQPKPSSIVSVLMGGLIIVEVELLAGLLVNRSYQVWDYRQLPLNFHGQICLPYFLLWLPISAIALPVYRFLDRKL